MSMPPNPTPLDPLQERYFALIDRLLECPNGEEPQVLNTEPDLLTPGFVQALMQTASYFAHQDNADAARFLIFIARELSYQLGLYPDPEAGSGGAANSGANNRDSNNTGPESASQPAPASKPTARPPVL